MQLNLAYLALVFFLMSLNSLLSFIFYIVLTDKVSMPLVKYKSFYIDLFAQGVQDPLFIKLNIVLGKHGDTL